LWKAGWIHLFSLLKVLGGGLGERIVTQQREQAFEKPFGSDLPSATEQAADLGGALTEDQIYRVDHYLGKACASSLVFVKLLHLLAPVNFAACANAD
jgi:glucose-6-phosphate 1-dehydrogenase